MANTILTAFIITSLWVGTVLCMGTSCWASEQRGRVKVWPWVVAFTVLLTLATTATWTYVAHHDEPSPPKCKPCPAPDNPQENF